jgi:SNF2 family DNA or RNA helicase
LEYSAGVRVCTRRKTLQGITLLWTLLQSGHALLGGAPIAKRVIICCPTSLVSNWDSECYKWLKARSAWPYVMCPWPLDLSF